MTARNDLENAFSILDAGITAHVSALQASKAAHTHAVAQAAANDDSYIQTLTTKVLSWADTLNASNPVVVPRPVLTPDMQVASQVSQVLPASPAPSVSVAAPPVAPVAPEAPVAPNEVFPDGHVPSVLETMEAAVKAMMAHK